MEKRKIMKTIAALFISFHISSFRFKMFSHHLSLLFSFMKCIFIILTFIFHIISPPPPTWMKVSFSCMDGCVRVFLYAYACISSRCISNGQVFCCWMLQFLWMNFVLWQQHFKITNGIEKCNQNKTFFFLSLTLSLSTLLSLKLYIFCKCFCCWYDRKFPIIN